ncbi:DUF6519 domain-containing protein [Geodermatophilus sp. SYSU D00691]
MIGDYTKVPLRDGERWTGARMQQGRVLLDHEWNLNIDAADRTLRGAARDVIGPAGVPVGSRAFQVGLTTTAPRDLTLQPGRIWVDGQAAYAPTAFRYRDQVDVPDLPAAGRALVFLDVFPEHLQPAEAWDEIVDPALDPVEAGARTRVGFRVRVTATTAANCQAALAALRPEALSTGLMTISRAVPATTPDPCDPPGDPLGMLPNGLFRVEVLDGGSATTARFAWAADDGASTVRALSIAGNEVRLGRSPAVKFAAQDLVEVSWLTRRADRRAHGALYRVTVVTPDEAGDRLTLDRAVSGVPTGGGGIVVRRWDGQMVGAATDVTALVRTVDLGLRFRAAATVGTPAVAATYLTGDAWQAWLRPASSTGVEPRTAVAADGIPHSFVALAMLDLTAGTVEDCRPTFPPLTALPRTTCTVTAFPGDDLQALANSLPVSGGELCLAAGRYTLPRAVRLANRRRVVVTGVGPATVVTAPREEAVFRFEGCQEIEVTALRAEGGAASAELEGALTFVGCTRIRVSECHLACPDATGERSQTGLTVRGSTAALPREVRIEGNRLEVGTGQIGLLVVDGEDVLIRGNDIVHVATSKTFPLEPFVAELARVGADTDDKLRYGPRLLALQDQLRSRAERFLPQGLSMRQALRRAARELIDEGTIARAHELVGARSVAQLVTGLQGIVVAGRRARTIRVLDNVVSGVCQGIHVGTSDPTTRGRDLAEDVLISRNVVSVSLPALYNRGRHAVFVGNVGRLAVLETFAELRRLHNEERSPVDGIRVIGTFGPYLMVRESSLSGFTTGVRIEAEDPGGTHLWVVADTLASGVTDRLQSGSLTAVLAPAGADRPPNVALP